MSINSNDGCGSADLPKKPCDTSQRPARRYSHEKRIHPPVHLAVNFRTRAQVVDLRICGICILIGPDTRVRAPAQFSHPFQPGEEVSAILVRLVYHFNVGAVRLHLSKIFLRRFWIDDRDKRISLYPAEEA